MARSAWWRPGERLTSIPLFESPMGQCLGVQKRPKRSSAARSLVMWLSVIGWVGANRFSRADENGQLSCRSIPPPRPQAVVKAWSGRLLLRGTNAALQQAVARWAEQTTQALARWSGYEFCFSNRVLTVYIEPAPRPGGPSISIAQEWDGARLLQWLSLADVENLDRETAEEALGFLLLQGEVLLRRLSMTGSAASFPRVEVAPRWLVQGLVQNADPARRFRNAELVLGRWSAGQIPSIRDWNPLLCPESGADVPPYPSSEDEAFHRATAGLLTGWLFYHLRGHAPLASMIEELAQGRRLTAEWVAARMPPGVDFEAGWDAWLLRQRRTVHLPGQITRTTVDQIRSALLLFAPHSAMRGRDGQQRDFLLPSDLIATRNAPEVREACRGKAVALRLLAAGRGESAQAAAAAYARFFESVAAGAPPRRLRRQLAEAEETLRALERRLSENLDEPGDTKASLASGTGDE